MKEAIESYSKGEMDRKRKPQGESPNPVFRYDSDIEKEAIQKMDKEEMLSAIENLSENEDGAAAIGEILMIIMTIIMAAVLLRSFT